MLISFILMAMFANSALASQLTLTWNDNSDNEDGFRIERSLDGETYDSIGSVVANVSTYLDTTIVEGLAYTYRVKAFNEFGDSGYSNTASGIIESPNSPPTISALSDIPIFEGSSTGALAFTIGDAETSASALSVSASSSNQSLVSDGNITLGGSGANRTVSVAPLAGKTGTATISITVDDGTDSIVETFVLTVEIQPVSEDQTIEVNFSALLGGSYETGQSDSFQVLVAGAQSNIQNVQFFDNDALVNTEKFEPYDFTFSASTIGSHTLKAVVNTDLGVYEKTVVVAVQSPPNTPPTIGSLSDATIYEGSSTGALSFTIGDAETSAVALTVSASSSNASLLSASGITLGGSGANRTIALQPEDGASGTTVVTVWVGDGVETVAGSFTLSVQPLTAPTIGSFSDVSILEGGFSGEIEFAIGDGETNVSELSVSASSSNELLLSSGSIELGGSGSSRSISLTPVGGASGSSLVSVSVSDGLYTTTASFTLFVQSVTAPTISAIDSYSIDRGNAFEPIAFVIGDEESVAQDLSVSVTSSNAGLIPLENITVSGSGTDRSLLVTPALNAMGSSTITVIVSDGSGEAMRTFELSVLSAPIILSQPANTETIVGDITSLDIEVEAYPAAVFQWFFNGLLIEGANAARLLITEATKSDEGLYQVMVANSQGNVSSEAVQLTVESLIQVVQAPIDVTIIGEGVAILSVSAEGPGLAYQWYRGESGDKSSPIEGATSSSYQTDILSADAKYWVEIKTGGLAQGLESFSSDTTTVFFQPIPRYFFGSFGPGDQGSFGLLVREDNTAVLLAEIGVLGQLLESSDLTVTPEGGFSYAEAGVVILSGTIDGDTVSGSVAGTEIVFQGTKSDPLGMTADFAGFYYAVMPNTSDGQVLVIAGPDGASFVSAGLGSEGAAGEAAIDISGTLIADLNETYSLAMALDSSSGTLNGAVLVAAASYSVDGQREDVPTNNILLNTSIRGQVKSGSSTMIAGFVVGGTGTKKVLIRGIGPSLSSRGIANVVSDPKITLYSHGKSEPVGQNDDWANASNASEVAISAQLVGASPFASNSRDAAMLVELPSGLYTAHITNGDGTAGTALVEIFDVSEAEGVESNTALVNISMRGEVATGDNVIIAGFVVTGDSPKRLLVRAMGPELQRFDVGGTLADPRLTIYKATNEGAIEVGGNEDWHEDAAVVTSAAAQSGAFSFDEGSKSAAQVIWLDPGLYTAVAASGDGSSGVALVEVYEVK